MNWKQHQGHEIPHTGQSGRPATEPQANSTSPVYPTGASSSSTNFIVDYQVFQVAFLAPGF